MNFREKAAYLAEIVRHLLVNSPVVYVAGVERAERQALFAAFGELVGRVGVLSRTDSSGDSPVFPLDDMVERVEECSFLVITDPLSYSDAGKAIEHLRRMAACFRCVLMLVGDSVEDLSALNLRLVPQSIAVVAFQEAEMRISLLSQWPHTYIALSAEDDSPRLISSDDRFVNAVGHFVTTIVSPTCEL